MRRDLSQILTKDYYYLLQLSKQILKVKDNKKHYDQLSDKFNRRYQYSHDAYKKRLQNLPEPKLNADLPVISEQQAIKQLIAENQIVIVSGETGSGKTTQLPQICLSLGLGSKGMIAHTQPRRIAAKSIAQRIAEELNVEMGTQVGYQVRFDEQYTADTYIKLMTDGMLLSETIQDKFLSKYEVIIIDEAHERSLNIDFLLGYLAKIRKNRPDLKIIITSATIDSDKFSKHFDNAPQINVSGRTYPVDIIYRPPANDSDMNEAIADAVHEIDQSYYSADILVFLATAREIIEAKYYLDKQTLDNTEIIALYGRLSLADQNKVFHPKSKRRIILTTNVAETSLTVPRIKYVIDTGTARISRYSLRLKMQRLPIEVISQASANQRAGRCGRNSHGICIRLYSEEDFLNRPLFTEPEIRRTNLSAVILQMLLLRLGDIEKFPFVDSPDPRQINDGYRLLYELLAVDKHYKITDLGKRMAVFPIDPRFARIIFAGESNGCLHEVLVILGFLSIQDPREQPYGKEQIARQKQHEFSDKSSDFQSILNLFFQYQKQRKILSNSKLKLWCKQYFLNALRMREWRELVNQLLKQCHQQKMKMTLIDVKQLVIPEDCVAGSKGSLGYENPQSVALNQSLLTGFLDQVGLWDASQNYYQGPRNRKFVIFPSSILSRKPPQSVMAASIIETSRTFAMTCASVPLNYLESIAPHLVKQQLNHPHWSKKQGNVIAEMTILLYGLPIVAGRKQVYARHNPQLAHQIFVEEALVTGEINTKLSVISDNVTLRDDLETLEDKTRSRGILIDDRQVAEFYYQHLPESVSSTVSLERWVKENGDANLRMQQSDLLIENIELSTLDYPDYLLLRGQQFKLEYAFNPGGKADGITVVIPVSALNALKSSDFERLVPAMLAGKIEAILRALPKVWRRQIVPIPDISQQIHKLIKDTHTEPLIQSIIKAIQKIKAINIPTSAFTESQIDTHYLMNYKIIDDARKTLDESRDLEALQKQWNHQARQQFQENMQSEFSSQMPITDWLWQALPQQEKMDNAVMGYPALTLKNKQLFLCVYDNPKQAESAHTQGVIALLSLKLSKSCKYIQKNFPRLTQLQLFYQKVLNTANKPEQVNPLMDDILVSLIAGVCFDKQQAPRERAAFDEALKKGQSSLIEASTHLADVLFQLLESYSSLCTQLQKVKSKPFKCELQLQLEQLVFPGFVKVVPQSKLIHHARYLKALLLRLEKFQREPLKDMQRNKNLQQWNDLFEKGLENLNATHIYQTSDQDESALRFREFFYALEEYRVQIFAQELGVNQKVSEKILLQKYPFSK